MRYPAMLRSRGQDADGRLCCTGPKTVVLRSWWKFEGGVISELMRWIPPPLEPEGVTYERMFRGQLVPNTRKPVRGQAFNGRERSSRYDTPQGQIRGTTALKKRFDIARPLKQAMKARQSGDLRA